MSLSFRQMSAAPSTIRPPSPDDDDERKPTLPRPVNATLRATHVTTLWFAPGGLCPRIGSVLGKGCHVTCLHIIMRPTLLIACIVACVMLTYYIGATLFEHSFHSLLLQGVVMWTEVRASRVVPCVTLEDLVATSDVLRLHTIDVFAGGPAEHGAVPPKSRRPVGSADAQRIRARFGVRARSDDIKVNCF